MFKPLFEFKYKYLYFALIFALSVLLSFKGNLVLAGISAAIGGACFAILSFSSFNKKLLVILPFASFITSWLVTSDGFKAFLSLSYLPVGIMVSYCVSKLKKATQTIMLTAFALGAFYLLIYCAHIIYAYGYLNIDSVKAYINLFLNKIDVSIRESIKSILLQTGQSVLTEETIKDILLYFKYSFAGLYISGLLIASFASFIIFKLTVSKIECNDEITDHVKDSKIVLSKQAAVFYILLYLINFFSNSIPSYMYLAIQSVIIPIRIGLVYMGAIVLWQRFKAGKISFIIIALVAFASISFFSIMISIITLFGLFDVFKKNRRINNSL